MRYGRAVLPTYSGAGGEGRGRPAREGEQRSSARRSELERLPARGRGKSRGPTHVRFPPTATVLLTQRTLRQNEPATRDAPNDQVPRSRQYLPSRGLRQRHKASHEPTFQRIQGDPYRASYLKATPSTTHVRQFRQASYGSLSCLRPSRRLTTKRAKEDQNIPHPYLPPYHRVLPTPATFQRSTRETRTKAMLPPLLQPQDRMPPKLRAILSYATHLRTQQGRLSKDPTEQRIAPSTHHTKV